MQSAWNGAGADYSMTSGSVDSPSCTSQAQREACTGLPTLTFFCLHIIHWSFYSDSQRGAETYTKQKCMFMSPVIFQILPMQFLLTNLWLLPKTEARLKNNQYPLKTLYMSEVLFNISNCFPNTLFWTFWEAPLHRRFSNYSVLTFLPCPLSRQQP